MASFNRVLVMGNLGQDPEIRYTQNRTAVATFNIATTEYRKSPDGQRQEQTEWHRIVVWDKQAENCAKYLSKGRPVFVEGKLQTRAWEDKQGVKRYTTEIVAQTVQFLGGAPSQQRENSIQPGTQPAGYPDEFQYPESSKNSGLIDAPDAGIGGPNTSGIGDDIPF